MLYLESGSKDLKIGIKNGHAQNLQREKFRLKVRNMQSTEIL